MDLFVTEGFHYLQLMLYTYEDDFKLPPIIDGRIIWHLVGFTGSPSACGQLARADVRLRWPCQPATSYLLPAAC